MASATRVLFVCATALLVAGCAALPAGKAVQGTLSEMHHEAQDVARDQETISAPAAVVPLSQLPFTPKPDAFFSLLESDQAPAIPSVGNARNGRPCKQGFGCIYETGVCCEGGEVCCEYACRKTNPPTCGPTPQQIALILARKKMELEARQEIEHERNLRAASETGKKAAQETAQKKKQEQRMKAKMALEEQATKKQDQQREAEQKAEVTAEEQKAKQKEAKEKHQLREKQEAALKASMQVTIRPDNFNPEKNKILLQGSRIQAADSRTYMFWARPSGTQTGWSNLFRKGANNGQRDPAVFIYPGSTRLHIRSGTEGNANDGADPEELLPMFKWTHVAFAHSKTTFIVYFNGKKVLEKKLGGGPLANSGDLWGSDESHDPALVTMSDFKYLPRMASEADLAEAIKQKNYQEIKSNTMILREENIKPVQGTILKDAGAIKKAAAQTWMFWVKPEGIRGPWSNLLHKGGTDHNRNPAIWFFPGSTRLHIRSGTRDNWNNGIDPEEQLAVEKWTHVAFTHKEGLMVVYYNGQQVGQANIPQPLSNDAPLYCGNPWYQSPAAELADIRYVDSFMDVHEIKAIVEEKKYRKKVPKELFMGTMQFKPSKGQQLPAQTSRTSGNSETIPEHLSYSWSLWVRPAGIDNNWSNIIHKGNSDSERGIAIWFYPGSTRLHIRSRTSADNNDGLDPPQNLPMNEWTHVVVVHHHQHMEVFYNGKSVGKEVRQQPVPNSGPIYGSNPWYNAAQCTVHDFRFYPGGVITQKKINELFAVKP